MNFSIHWNLQCESSWKQRALLNLRINAWISNHQFICFCLPFNNHAAECEERMQCITASKQCQHGKILKLEITFPPSHSDDMKSFRLIAFPYRLTWVKRMLTENFMFLFLNATQNLPREDVALSVIGNQNQDPNIIIIRDGPITQTVTCQRSGLCWKN